MLVLSQSKGRRAVCGKQNTHSTVQFWMIAGVAVGLPLLFCRRWRDRWNSRGQLRGETEHAVAQAVAQPGENVRAGIAQAVFGGLGQLVESGL